MEGVGVLWGQRRQKKWSIYSEMCFAVFVFILISN